MDSQLVAFPPKVLNQELYLIGFRLDPSAEGPQFYTLIGSRRGERTSDHPRRAGAVLPPSGRRAEGADGERQRLRRRASGADGAGVAVRHRARRSTLPTRRTEDGDGVLFELIAVFDDLLRAVKLNVPAEYAAVLGAVAERLGESQEFASFLAESGMSAGKAGRRAAVVRGSGGGEEQLGGVSVRAAILQWMLAA